jgi:hypothetical protein
MGRPYHANQSPLEISILVVWSRQVIDCGKETVLPMFVYWATDDRADKSL